MGDGQVKVRFGAGGICGSDLSYYGKGRVGDFAVMQPLCLGPRGVGRSGWKWALASPPSEKRAIASPSPESAMPCLSHLCRRPGHLCLKMNFMAARRCSRTSRACSAR